MHRGVLLHQGWERDDRGVVWGCVVERACAQAAEYGGKIPGGIVDELEQRLVDGVKLGVRMDGSAGLAEGLADGPVERR